ncbi:YdeI/OmpD-associated family protein [Polyangium sorediatum]|uniref:YdeI/OmpD-associated family protein n=1 Tax=Polyangium sorediatum TaxID=889274 RepID=A0ABT6P5E7_9BACT|nr:YdeI/OmpD-associated family protein [Polyangium sorediatum]MDI1435410.1 YdeI/OmpD-associated family protein [Polyangium sorediatum]
MTTAPSPLSKKLQIKPNARVLVLGAPEGRAALLDPLPEGASVGRAARGAFDVVLLFVEKAKELEKGGPKAISAVREGGVLWVAYPKKSSKVETDLTRDVGWKVIEEAGWGGVAQVAMDETWSALRFKPEATVARKENSAAAPGARKMGAAKKGLVVAAPSDLAAALAEDAAASRTWEALAPSHRKEYVGWIEEAKKPETRARRIASSVEMMAAGVKDRNAKYAR